jgi:formimidoylglutamate deiminase
MSDIIEADLTWTGTSFESGVQVEIDGGVIQRVGPLGGRATKRLRRRALLPGMVNVHSHAFQRGLRGRGERFPSGAGSFWTWREAMYGLVETMHEEAFFDVCLQAYREMLQAGITTVGEFHYFHHGGRGRDFALDRTVVRAAREAGIRLVLLNAYYRTGAIGQPLNDAQQRFATDDLDAYWHNLDELAESLDSSRHTLGVVAHSLRAVPLEDLVALHTESVRRGMVFHLHIEEQRQEVAECIEAYGRPPMQLLNELCQSTENVTGVHCTHTRSEDMETFLARGGTVCICPTTEANLGDGIPDLVHVVGAGGRICLGTDSNARISMQEEMRWVEYGQRLTHERRGVLRGADGAVARSLLDLATVNGARSLGIDAGRIAAGALADFTTLDLDAGPLAGWDPDSLLAAFVTGADASVIGESCVGGQWLNDL